MKFLMLALCATLCGSLGACAAVETASFGQKAMTERFVAQPHHGIPVTVMHARISDAGRSEAVRDCAAYDRRAVFDHWNGRQAIYICI